MIRVIIGAAAASVAMFVLGFIFFASGLQNLATRDLGDVQAGEPAEGLDPSTAELMKRLMV